MKQRVIAGNWKMHHGPSATRRFFQEFSPRLSAPEPLILTFPPAISLLAAVEARRGRPEVALGVQSIHWEPEGAFTGEISAGMASSAGARYVLVGHSERRHVFGETDEEVARKVGAAADENNVVFDLHVAVHDVSAAVAGQIAYLNIHRDLSAYQ